MTENSLVLQLNHCIYIEAISPTIFRLLSLSIEITAVRIEKDIIFQKIIKKSLKKDITDFLQTSNKLFGKKKR